MRLVNIGVEITSLVKWSGVLTTINAGTLCIVFAQMSELNHCDKNMFEAFFRPGVFALIVGGLGLFFAVIASLVPIIRRLRRRYGRR